MDLTTLARRAVEILCPECAIQDVLNFAFCTPYGHETAVGIAHAPDTCSRRSHWVFYEAHLGGINRIFLATYTPAVEAAGATRRGGLEVSHRPSIFRTVCK